MEIYIYICLALGNKIILLLQIKCDSFVYIIINFRLAKLFKVEHKNVIAHILLVCTE